MNVTLKLKIGALAIATGAAVFIAAASMAAADATPLAVTCAGNVSGNTVSWTASPSGGVAPYSVLWSGDPSVASSTATSVVVTYSANGTYQAMVRATDASSTVATSSCSATVSSIVVPVPTSTVNVAVAVNNTAGGTALPSGFTISATGASSTPSSFVGSASGTAVTVNAGQSFSIAPSSLAHYSSALSGVCSGSLSAGATSTCTVTETYVPPAAQVSTGTLNVVLAVNNTAGGTALPSGFSIVVNGAGASPSSFAGNSAGTAVIVNGSSTYTIGVYPVLNYTGAASGNCGGPVAPGTSATCTITETFVPSTGTTTSTTPLPRVNQPSLSIGPNGNFLARGMTVTSVASGSFQASVWGITYTVDWSGDLYPQFYFRGGNRWNTSTTNPARQLSVGDEVGVSGRVTSANPLVVTANVVRDYSIAAPRGNLIRPEQKDGEQVFGQGGNGNESVQNAQARLNDLLAQLRSLEKIFQSRGGR